MNGRTAAIAAVALLAGCAGLHRAAKPEALAEVDIRAGMDAAKAAAAKAFVDDGYAVTPDGESSLVAEKRLSSRGDALVYGSETETTPSVQVELGFSRAGDGVHAQARARRLTHQGSGLLEMENAVDLTAQLQATLETVKRSLEGAPPEPKK